MDEKHFFDTVRPLFGSLQNSQMEGMRAIAANHTPDVRFNAYMLATAFHETGKEMQPIHEKGGSAYFTDRYDINGSHKDIAERLGNTTPGDGVRFHGRGLVQLTGRANYARASKELGVDFVGTPDLALKINYASAIMGLGMTEGWFTTRKLSQYFNDTTDDALNARRIINGVDKAALIASYYNVFKSALS